MCLWFGLLLVPSNPPKTWIATKWRIPPFLGDDLHMAAAHERLPPEPNSLFVQG